MIPVLIIIGMVILVAISVVYSEGASAKKRSLTKKSDIPLAPQSTERSHKQSNTFFRSILWVGLAAATVFASYELKKLWDAYNLFAGKNEKANMIDYQDEVKQWLNDDKDLKKNDISCKEVVLRKISDGEYKGWATLNSGDIVQITVEKAGDEFLMRCLDCGKAILRNSLRKVETVFEAMETAEKMKALVGVVNNFYKEKGR